jgi:peroxiredoxin Q/BCP
MAAKKTKTKVSPPKAAERAASAERTRAVAKTAPPAKKAPPVKKAPLSKTSKAASPAATSSEHLLAEGSKAPAFSLPDENGAVLTSASLAGKPYVLYFYPKDDTPGCTQEACDFRDNFAAFGVKKVRVIGVSPDESKRHAKFKEKYGLTFTLLADTDKSLSAAYGVWAKKSNYGREYMGVLRSTFLIDKAGTIAKVWRGVRVAGHVDAVLASL